ncbi:MAG TPA: phosphoserine transaminase [Polyangiaceae bacterium]|nr:phosphoserine transaminase [Polyangiaceae bacterium]
MQEPAIKPSRPSFSSGPCVKRPGWSPAVLASAFVGRSHRSAPGKARLGEVIERTRALLSLPADYRLAIVPASDTGAVEMMLWSVLGERGVDMLAWESFGATWVTDVVKQLKLSDVRRLEAEYGALPDLRAVDTDRDVVFTWNGTTSGVCVPNADWISDARKGLTICDATSAVFAMPLPWQKLDVITWSWQKVLGGEAAHGMLALSPRAVQRLESFVPPRPLPKIFRLTKNGKLNEDIFKGSTINTPSMLCVEDALDSLRWAESVGGLAGTIERSRRNLGVISRWVEKTPWVEFLAQDPATRSCTSICLKIVAEWFQALPVEGRAAAVKRLTGLLDQKGAAHDIGSYVEAPPGLRIWGGATVEASDLEALTPWLDWAYAEVERSQRA